MELMLDTVGYSSKPDKNDVRVISQRLLSNKVKMDAESLAIEVLAGKSFVPGVMSKVNGSIKRRKENWIEQHFICLDFDEGMKLEEAKETFKDNAAFIYETFSHTEDNHKFRVVMILNEPITEYKDLEATYQYYLDKYPADKQCKDGSRIFYGGKNVHVIDYNNRIHKVKYINKYKENDKKSSITTLHREDLSTPIYKNNLVGVDKRVELIKNGDYDTLNKLLGEDEKTFYTRTEAVEYLNNINISELLGIENPKKFSCLFHEDDSPSANIFIKKDDDGLSVHVYKCFSSDCKFNHGTVRKLIEHLRSCNKTQAFDFLLKVYNIKIEETEDQKEQRAELQKNIQLLIDGTLKNDHEALYERIRPYIKDLIVLHTIAKENLPPKHYNEDQIEFLVFCSMRHIANIIGLKDHKRIMKTLSLFCYLGLLFKKDKDSLPEGFLEDVERVIGETNTNRISFFGIPKYEESKHFEFGEQKAIEFKENNMNMNSFGYEMLLRTVGFNEANRVYPKRKQKNLSKKQSDLSSIFEKVVMRQIQDYGWTTANLIKEEIQATEGFKENKLKMIIGEIVNKYDLEVIQLNKDIKEKYDIDLKGYPRIICQNGFIKKEEY